MSKENWSLFVEGHASKGESANDGAVDAMTLSMLRAKEVTKFLVEKGVRAKKISSVFYGDHRPDEAFSNSDINPESKNRRVAFIIRKTDLKTKGHKVSPK